MQRFDQAADQIALAEYQLAAQAVQEGVPRLGEALRCAMKASVRSRYCAIDE